MMCGESQKNSEFFEQGIPSYMGIHDCVFLLCSVLEMSVESAPPVSEEKEEEVEEKEKEEERKEEREEEGKTVMGKNNSPETQT